MTHKAITQMEWFEKNNVTLYEYDKAFGKLFTQYQAQREAEYECKKALIGELEVNQKLTETLSALSPMSVNPPLVVNSPKQEQFDKAIELLEACSEDLFINSIDELLETRIDEFLKTL